ncbi:MAG: hypothetical protein R3A48_06140 [Polyangiales bacterium]
MSARAPGLMFAAVLAAASAACSGTRTYVRVESPPGSWAGVQAIALNSISWRSARVDGVAYDEFESLLAPQRRVPLLADITNASRVLAETLRERVRGVAIVSGRRGPQMRIEVLSWERGYYSLVPKATQLRVRVILGRSPGRADDVVDFDATYHHTIYRPNPAAGVRNAAELLANELSAWLELRMRR